MDSLHADAGVGCKRWQRRGCCGRERQRQRRRNRRCRHRNTGNEQPAAASRRRVGSGHAVREARRLGERRLRCADGAGEQLVELARGVGCGVGVRWAGWGGRKSKSARPARRPAVASGNERGRALACGPMTGRGASTVVAAATDLSRRNPCLPSCPQLERQRQIQTSPSAFSATPSTSSSVPAHSLTSCSATLPYASLVALPYTPHEFFRRLTPSVRRRRSPRLPARPDVKPRPLRRPPASADAARHPGIDPAPAKSHRPARRSSTQPATETRPDSLL